MLCASTAHSDVYRRKEAPPDLHQIQEAKFVSIHSFLRPLIENPLARCLPLAAMPLLHVLLFLSLLTLCSAREPECAYLDYPPRGEDCLEISMKLHEASLLPGGRVMKEWGRALPNTDTTGSLPKLYWVTGAGPKTCGVEVNVNPRTPDATDMLSLYDIAFGAGQVVVKCFFNQGVLGLYRTGAHRRIEVKMVKINKPGLMRPGQEEETGSSSGGSGQLRSSEMGEYDIEDTNLDKGETDFL